MVLNRLKKLIKPNDTPDAPWQVEALESLLAIFPKATEERPSRDGTCLNWKRINKVTAYKADLFTEDLVCMLFETDSGHGIEVHEEMLGFDEFLNALPTKLPGFPTRTSWWSKVVQPPFETNQTILWKHKEPSDDE